MYTEIENLLLYMYSNKNVLYNVIHIGFGPLYRLKDTQLYPLANNNTIYISLTIVHLII